MGFLGAKNHKLSSKLARLICLRLEDHQTAAWEACGVINRILEGMLTKAYSGEVSEMYVALPTQCV